MTQLSDPALIRAIPNDDYIDATVTQHRTWLSQQGLSWADYMMMPTDDRHALSERYCEHVEQTTKEAIEEAKAEQRHEWQQWVNYACMVVGVMCAAVVAGALLGMR